MDLSTLLARRLSGRGDQPALESGAHTWSYDDLDRVTRARAALLREAVPGGGRVALAGDHTAESLIWALAVMRSGLVYTPFNAGLPTARIREALDVAAPSLVLCCADSAAQALRDADPDRPVVTAGELAGGRPTPPDAPEAWPVAPVAYSIFTSGSTGRPKLVNVGHRGVEHLCRAQTRLFGVRPGIRMVQFSSLSFDASVAEILVALFAGATLVVPPWDGGSWVTAVGRHLRDHGCDLITLPPSVYNRLDDGARRGIRAIVFAGEALSEAEWRTAARHSRVINAYGPTEGTVCFSVTELDRYSMSVGRPIDGYRAYVHACGAYAPSGRGELVLAGDGVALGYEGADGGLPFTTVDGDPAYHTGDEVELRDGEVFYLGRLDDQIKRLGHRIGLTELEGRLAGLIGSRVAAFTDGTALVVAHTATHRSEPELRTRLRELLAPWEVPDVLLAVPELPITDAGKVDRDALRAIAPATVAETTNSQTVGEIVERVLGAAIGPGTSVFDAGGTSFTLVQLQVELAEVYGEQVVQDAFEQLNYDFTIQGFLAALGGPQAGGVSQDGQVAASILADLATMRPAHTRRRTGGVILTGASGFIGGYVLERLLEGGTPVTVVTSGSPQRLTQQHRARFGREPAVRILGYDDLTGSDDWGAVVHCGFEVNHLLPLERHVKGSISTTRALVRAAAEHGAHRFVFLSAASIGARFVPFGADTLGAVADPYSQAKFIAEAYIQTLQSDACTTDLLRAGLVYGHTPRERNLLEHDVFAALLRLSTRHGILPRLSGLVPVCHVADVVDALLTAAAGGDAPPRREVLVQRTYDLDALRDEAGLGDLRLVDVPDWLATVTASAETDPRILAALRFWLREAGWQEPVRTTDRPIIRELQLTIGD